MHHGPLADRRSHPVTVSGLDPLRARVTRPRRAERGPERMLSSMRAAILTVSTSVAAGTTEDRSGVALAEAARAAGAEIVAQDVLPDQQGAIEAWLRTQVD